MLGIVIAGGLAAACETTAKLPTAPPQAAATLQSIAITGLPSALVVDETAQLAALGRYTDGRSEEITAKVAWSAQTAACSISASAVVKGLTEGECGVQAALDGVRAAGVVPIGPSKTFSISGVVREKWGVGEPPIPFATVELLSGAQAGKRTTADTQGRFTFNGVPKESIQIRALRSGFESNTDDVSPSRSAIEFRLSPEFQVIFRRDTYQPGGPLALSTVLPFTVGRRGPVSVRGVANVNQCGGSVEWSRMLLRPANSDTLFLADLYACTANRPVTADLVLDPGNYRLNIQWGNFAGLIGDVELRHPR